MIRALLRVLNGPLLILLVAVGIAIQSSLFTSWPLLYFQPDVVLLVVVWVALQRGLGEGAAITLIIAEMAEIHSATPQGVFLICYMTVYLMVRVISQFIVIPSVFSNAMLTLGSSVLWKLTGLFVLYLLGVSANQWRHTFTLMFIGAAIEGTFSIWVYRWLEKLDWATFKNIRAERALDEDLQLDSEGL